MGLAQKSTAPRAMARTAFSSSALPVITITLVWGVRRIISEEDLILPEVYPG